MSDVQKISIAVTGEQLRAIKDAVDSGAYASTSEVIRDALRGWQLREPLRKAEVERLRKAWDEGIASGPARELDIGELKRRGRERLAEFKKRA